MLRACVVSIREKVFLRGDQVWAEDRSTHLYMVDQSSHHRVEAVSVLTILMHDILRTYLIINNPSPIETGYLHQMMPGAQLQRVSAKLHRVSENA